MNIGWVTPFSHRSAIGRFSATVTEQLRQRGHLVSIIRSETGSALREIPHPSRASILRWNANRQPDKFDIVVINFGDHYGFHRGGVALAAKTRAVGIFHDWYLFNLFSSWRDDDGSRPASERIVRRIYGDKALDLYRDTTDGKNQDVAAASFPMIEWMAEMMDGAIAHSHFYLDRLARSCPGPVIRIPLAIAPRAKLPASPRSDGVVRVLTFGMINPNKRVESILRALACLPDLAPRISYRAVGMVIESERKRLEKLARELRISDFRLEGEVTDKTLDRHLADADIVCCLRFPSLEGSSCSLAEAMSLGKAIITTDTGCYAELPDGLVLKVRPKMETTDLPKHLRTLIESPDDRLRLGAAAAEWIKTESCPSRYADLLLNHLETVIRAQPLLRCAENLGNETGVLELPGNDPYILHLENQMKSLWAG